MIRLMVRGYVALWALLFLFCFCFSTMADVAEDDSVKWMPGELLVKYKPGVSTVQMDTTHKTMGITSVRVLDAGDSNDWRVVQFDPLENVKDKAKAYYKTGLIQYAEPNYVAHLCDVPNDPAFADTDKTYSFDITETTKAWDTITDASSVTVAVVDTGVDYRHEDLYKNIWENPYPMQGDIYGVSIYRGNKTFNPMDKDGHGTHVAGIIGARGNNGKGTAGVCWNVKLMICKVLEKELGGLIYVSDIVEGIVYAREHGARVVNLSLGVEYESAPMREEVEACQKAGVLLVCAAGNKGADTDKYPHYPAYYCVDYDNVLSVGSSDSEDNVAAYSNYGKMSVQVFAPGCGIYSTWKGGEYETESGTSMSTPFVSGAAALCMAAHPDEDYLQIRNRILANVDAIEGLAEKCVSGGRINVNKMIHGTADGNIGFIDIVGLHQVGINEKAGYKCVAVYGDGTSEPVEATWKVTSGTDVASIDKSGELTGLADGYVTIEAKYKKNGNTLKATKKIAIGAETEQLVTYYDEDGLIYTLYLKAKKAHLSGCSEGLTGAIMPMDSIYFTGNDYPVVSIDRAAFSKSEITSIIIPASIIEIGSSAFSACSELTNVIFEEESQLTEIGKLAFANCWTLREITIPSGVTEIKPNTFYKCFNLINIEIPSGVTSIGDNAFYDCQSLVSLEIPESVTEIGNLAFAECISLRKVLFLGKQPQAREYVFENARKLKYIYFTQGKAGWGDGDTWCDKTTKVEEKKPELYEEMKNGRLVLTYTGNLETSTDGVHWKTMNAASPYSVKAKETRRFFRAVE